jgi:aspartate 1-decarboxylase
MCKGKIHRATVTKVDLHYEGSIGIDKLLLKASDIYPGEYVQVVNINNGARFGTYTIEEPAGSGQINLFGAAAHLAKPGDLVIILSYAYMEDKLAKKIKVKRAYVNAGNKIVKKI